MRDREFKYIYFADPEFPPILFDLRSDPDELNNVAGLAEYAAIELSCCHKLLRWRMYNEDQRMEHWAQPLREADLLLVQRSADGRTTCAADNTAADYADIELQHSVPTLGFVTW